jgi:hypothetical protein
VWRRLCWGFLQKSFPASMVTTLAPSRSCGGYCTGVFCRCILAPACSRLVLRKRDGIHLLWCRLEVARMRLRWLWLLGDVSPPMLDLWVRFRCLRRMDLAVLQRCYQSPYGLRCAVDLRSSCWCWRSAAVSGVVVGHENLQGPLCNISIC